jgi:hypothetical protein
MEFMNKVIVYHHLGLGDHFICNGLVHALSNQYDTIYLPCWKKYYPTVAHLYSEFENIQVFSIDKEPDDILSYDSKIPIIAIGFNNVDVTQFERSFYKQVNLPYETRFTEFRLPSNDLRSKLFYEKVKQKLGDDYIFVHNESSVGIFHLSIKPGLPQHVSKISDTPNVIDYTETLKHAKEIHIINSSIAALVINMYYCGMLTQTKIVYHNIRKLSQGGIPLEIPSTIETIYYV